jgi:hypothetical protein
MKTKVDVASFEQATIKVEKETEFEELKSAISRAFGSERVERFLKRLDSSNIRVRDWDSVLAKGVLEKMDETLANSGKTALSLYQALTVSDRAQMREFYLSQIELVDATLRRRFKKLYQYY